MNDLARSLLHSNGFDHLAGFYCDARAARNVNTLVFNKSNPDEMTKVREVFAELVSRFAQLGYGEYRTHLAYMDQVAGTYNYNNGAMLGFQQTLKQAIDPNGIIAPGKSGVWPQAGGGS